jgi:hypothetical protein
VNGELVDVFPESILIDRFPVNTNDLLIGNRADFFTGFDGHIDDVALFDRVLSREEILVIMGGGFDFADLYPQIPANGLHIERVSQSLDLTLHWESNLQGLRVLEASQDLLTWRPVQFFDGSEEEGEYRISPDSSGPIFFRLLTR